MSAEPLVARIKARRKYIEDLWTLRLVNEVLELAPELDEVKSLRARVAELEASDGMGLEQARAVFEAHDISLVPWQVSRIEKLRG